METVADLIFLGSKITVVYDCSHEIKRHLLLGKKRYDQSIHLTKKQKHHLGDIGPCSQKLCFSNSHGQMWELDHKEGWVLKNWCFWTVLLEKTLESPLDCKEIQTVHPKGDQSWVFIGRTDAEAEGQYFGHWCQSADSLEKVLILGKIEGRMRKGWQRIRWLDSINYSMDMSLKKTQGDGEEQRSLMCCSPWSCKELDTTKWLTFSLSFTFQSQ